MFKIVVGLVAALIFVGCSSHSAHNMKHSHAKMPQMFQTVPYEKATLLQSGENKESCPVCGMNLVKFYKTTHGASHNGEMKQYCSIHCLADHLDSGNELKNPTVVDVKSLEMISVMEAHYVVGSKVRGTMSRVSKYAFKDFKDAQEFQKKHGGKILDFYGALEAAREDFK